MKLLKKISPLLLIFALLVVTVSPSISMAAEAPINLGMAKGFALLAGQTITNTGTTTINGNVGIAPGSSFTQGPAVINGTIHINDSIAIQAKQDLITAFNDAAGRNPVITIPTELGGSTLTPGYYVSAAGTFGLTGTLTLDAQGDSNAVFVFMTASSLITATSSQVKVINGADDSQVFWNVGSSATLGITSHLEGTIMAMESITLTTGATVNGALLARNGSVTLDSNTINTMTQPLIGIEKTADKSILSAGPETVTYTYKISNLGTSNLENVIVADDKISSVTYVSGDANADQILQPTEVWLYSGSMMVSETITNVVTVSANANNINVNDSATYTVTVLVEEATTDVDTTDTTVAPDTTSTTTPEPTVTTTTPTTEPTATTTIEPSSTPEEIDIDQGGELPQTATPLYLYLLGGFGFVLMGIVGLKLNSRI